MKTESESQCGEAGEDARFIRPRARVLPLAATDACDGNARRLQLPMPGITPAAAESGGGAFTSTLLDDLPVQREPFQDALYRVAQAAGPSSTDIDALLDAHRQAYGDPEQVAYGRQVDPCDERLVPVEGTAQVDEAVRDYLDEHARWRGR